MATAEGAASFLSGIILAAGTSARLGRPKQLLLLGDRCLLQHVLDAAAASRLDEIILVLGHRAEEIARAVQLPPGRSVRVVVNPDYAAGQSTSLRTGLSAVNARAAGAVILLGDQPTVTSALIDRVVEAFITSGLPVARPVYTSSSGKRVPAHPVLLARRVWPEVEKLRGDEGARVLLRTHPEWLFEVQIEGEPPVDIDTGEDYRQALSGAGAGRG